MTRKSSLGVLYLSHASDHSIFERAFGEEFRLVCVDAPEAALDVLRRDRIAVLVAEYDHLRDGNLLELSRNLHPGVVRVVICAPTDLDATLRGVNDGQVARFVTKPWSHAELHSVLAWGVEAFSLGQQNSALQVRLMQTERLVTLGSIGAAVIHDINQPLAYMLTNAERLQSFTTAMPSLLQLIQTHGSGLTDNERAQLTDLAAELPDIVEDMLAGCSVMHGLTGSVRRLLRPGTSPDVPRTDPVPVIRYALSVCQELALRAHASLHYEGPTHLPRLRVGSTELTQILINLVANGAQALMRREAPHGRLVVRVEERGDDLLAFEVQDDGPGMAPEVLARVGTPFFSTRPDGTGLGVAQCRRLVTREGGTFAIDSTLGRGTKVTFTLPRTP